MSRGVAVAMAKRERREEIVVSIRILMVVFGVHGVGISNAAMRAQ